LASVIAGIDASPEAAAAAHGSGLIASSPSAVRNGLVAETFMGGRPRRLLFLTIYKQVIIIINPTDSRDPSNHPNTTTVSRAGLAPPLLFISDRQRRTPNPRTLDSRRRTRRFSRLPIACSGKKAICRARHGTQPQDNPPR